MKRPHTKIGSAATLSLVLLVSMVYSTIFQAQSVSADIFAGWAINAAGTLSEGFFANRGISTSDRRSCGLSRCPVLPNGNYSRNALNNINYQTSSLSSVQKARTLVTELKQIYQSGNDGQLAWSQAGVAFIVNTMLGIGNESPLKTRTITTAMWDDVELRLVDRASKGRIQWNAVIGNDYGNSHRNTYVRQIRNNDGVFRWDVVYDTSVNSRPGMIIFNDNGSVAYRIWYICANPIGSATGVPVAENYTNEPSVAGSSPVADGGTSMTITPSVNNGGTTTSNGAAWELNRFIVPASNNSPVPSRATNNTAPRTYYGFGATRVTSGTQSFPPGVRNVAAGTRDIPDLEVGTRICFALSVRPYTQAVNSWRHSDPFCVTIAKSPKVQVVGGDIVAGRSQPASVIGSLTTRDVSGVRTFGSWGEYAIIASGPVRTFASGAGYSGGARSSLFCNVSYLTIGNASADSTCTPSTTYGTYDSTGTLSNLSGRFGTGTPIADNASINVSTLTPNRAVHSTQASTTIRVNAPTGIATGRWIVINAPNATVRITGNIEYNTSAVSNPSQLPQLVIIAGRIQIDEAVTNIDSWLVATTGAGTITTCRPITNANRATTLDSERCDDRLTVNGPVIARQLYLERTFGAGQGGDAGNPAEVFNLRPDAYLWATAYQASAGRVPTVYTTELPPRY